MSKKLTSEKGRKNLERKFLEAVDQSNVVAVKKCLSSGANPNALNEDGLSPFHTAAEKNDLLVLHELLAVPGVQLNLRSFIGLTPLMMACIYGHREIVQALLKQKADPNFTSYNGNTPLHYAAQQGNVGITFDLVNHGANVNNVTNVFDVTPLTAAVIYNPSMAIAKFLLRKGAMAQGTKEFPLLLECVLNCYSEERLNIIKLLVSYGMDVNLIHPHTGMNCLHYVAITGYVPLAEFLLEEGADLNTVDVTNRTPMMTAIDHQSKDIIKLFREWNMPKARKVYFNDE